MTSLSSPLGKDVISKSDEFFEKFQKGGGSFPIQKLAPPSKIIAQIYLPPFASLGNGDDNEVKCEIPSFQNLFTRFQLSGCFLPKAFLRAQ